MKILKAIMFVAMGTLSVHGGSLPMGYTALDYIEATAKQYIDTGVNAATSLKVTADFLSDICWNALVKQCPDFS